MLNEEDQATWRHVHIPHRVRAAIARLDMRQSILGVYPITNPSPRNRYEKIYWRCATDSINEGRLAATRYLTEFIGIKANKSGRPVAKHRQGADDITLTDLGGSLLPESDPNADCLAKIWTASTKATSHATHDSKHPEAGDEKLMEALTIIVQHLQDTIYEAAGEQLRDYVLRESG